MKRQGRQQSITLFQTFTTQLAEQVRSKAQAFFLPLLVGALLAIARRRTVTTWLRAAQISDDLKDVWDWGKQEVRLLETNEAVTTLNMLSFGLTELATWDRTFEELVDRRVLTSCHSTHFFDKFPCVHVVL
jgi:predicted nucleic acid-binding protein